jgi:hypothetical protein
LGFSQNETQILTYENLKISRLDYMLGNVLKALLILMLVQMGSFESSAQAKAGRRDEVLQCLRKYKTVSPRRVKGIKVGESVHVARLCTGVNHLPDQLGCGKVQTLQDCEVLTEYVPSCGGTLERTRRRLTSYMGSCDRGANVVRPSYTLPAAAERVPAAAAQPVAPGTPSVEQPAVPAPKSDGFEAIQ